MNTVPRNEIIRGKVVTIVKRGDTVKVFRNRRLVIVLKLKQGGAQ